MKKEIIKFAILLMVAMGAGPVTAQVWIWSLTASQNGSIDPSINMAEGMSPSAVNDSVRALMARVADWRDDSSGLLTTAGTSTAYTVTTNSGLNAVPNDGQLIAVTMHATNGASATLTADSGTTYPIQSAAGTAVPAGSLVLGTAYTLKFSLSAAAWITRDFYGSSFSVPLGAVLEFSGGTVPNSNFVFANGQCISRTTYAVYFAMVGVTYGACDGSTTFAVPDKRGRIAAGLDTMGGTPNQNRLSTVCSSNTVGAVCGAQQVVLNVLNLPPYTPVGSIVGTAQVGIGVNGISNASIPHTGAEGLVNNLTSFGSGTLQNVTFNLNNGTLAVSMNPQGGVSTPFNTVQPTLMLNYIVRIF